MEFIGLFTGILARRPDEVWSDDEEMEQGEHKCPNTRVDLSDMLKDSEDDLIMPEGPPPGPAPPGEGEDEDSDEDIPMPEGPPPGQEPTPGMYILRT